MMLSGRFNLDPNRVIDCVLEAFECQLKSEFYIPLLLKLSPSSETICELIGFKLTSADAPSDSLFQLIALLIVNKIIGIEEIYPWVCLILSFESMLYIYDMYFRIYSGLLRNNRSLFVVFIYISKVNSKKFQFVNFLFNYS